MFNHLPFEIRYTIFRNLRASELLVCLQTCRLWYNFIKSQHLITRLEVGSASQLDSIIQATKARKINGERVETLQATRISETTLVELLQVPDLFPALSTFVFDGTADTSYYPGTSNLLCTETAQKFKVWEKRLQKLVITATAADISTLFKTCHFHHLTELSLRCSNSMWEEKSVRDPVLEPITNMPQLRSLAFECVWLSFAGVELIHQNLPLLEKLQLKVMLSGGLIENITPATNITDFSIFLAHMPEDGDALLKYISTKYPSLIHLHMGSDVNYQEDPMALGMDLPNRFGADALLSFINQLPSTLKSYRNELVQITPSIMASLINAPFKLTQFHFHLTFMLPWFKTLSDANMLNTLQDLTTIVYHPEHVYLKGCAESALKRLHVLCRIDRYKTRVDAIYLERLFLAHPHLESLQLTATRHDLKVRPEIQSTLKITYLALHVRSLSKGIIPFIRDKMPYLKRLDIKTKRGAIDPKRPRKISREYIDLRHHCLEEIKLNISGPFNLIVCSINGKHYRYFIEKRKVVYYGTNSSLPDDGNYYLVGIECRNLNRLTINETMII